MKLVSVWRDGQWAQAPRSPRVLGLPPALSSLLPPSLLARGYLWSLLGGAFGPAGWLQRKHSIGAHILAQASQSCLASLCPRSVPAALLYSPLKGHSGTCGPQGTLTLSLEGLRLKTGGLHPPKSWLPSRYGSALIPVPVVQGGVWSSLEPDCSDDALLHLALVPAQTSWPKPLYQSDFPVPRRDSALTPGSPTWVL